MSVYVLDDIEVTDSAAYELHRKTAYPVIAKYLARGGATEIREGDWKPNRLVIVEFESIARAREWFESTEYRPALEVIPKCGRRSLLIVDGVAAD